MKVDPVLSPAEITWLLSSYRGHAADLPDPTAERLVKLGLMRSNPGSPAMITDAGRNWLARNGHLRRS